MVTHTHSRSVADWLLILTILPLFLYGVQQWNFLCDDAFISFRYARNLAEGYGLRFNIGEQPPVEGYSNFLWVVILALAIKAGVSALVASRVLSVVCGVILLASVYWQCRRWLGLDRLQAWLGTAACALLPPLLVWSTGGLETVPFTLLLFLLAVTLAADRPRFPFMPASLLGLAVMLMRPEGMGYPFLLLLLVPLLPGERFRSREWRRGAFRYLAVMLLGLLALAAWRLLYFDSLLPNTYYAKVGFTGSQFTRGAFYVIQFFLAFTGTAAVVLLSAVTVPRWGDRRHRFLLASLLLLLLLPALLGGDFMTMGRLLVPAVPFLALLLAAAVCPSRTALPRPRAVLLLAVSLSVIVLNLLPLSDRYLTPRSWRERVHFRWNMPNYLTEREIWEQMRDYTGKRTALGRALAEISRPDQWVVTTAIGAIGYFSRLQIYDKLGLVSREVARADRPREKRSAGHDKAVTFDHFLKYRPAFVNPRIVPAREEARTRKRMETSLRLLFKEHRSHYRIVSRPVAYRFDGQDAVLLTFQLKE